jgi:hypothetical protein
MRQLLSIRDFRLLFVGQAMSNWGDGLTTITLLILTQRLTGSTAAVAGTAIAIALPNSFWECWPASTSIGGIAAR